jgi:hypothetical protein
MTYKERAEETAGKLFQTLGVTPTEAQSVKAAGLIERALVEAAVESARHCAKVALDCCPEDMDIAHKISIEMRQAEQALIANLSAMR